MKYLMVERARVLQPSIFKMPTESIVHWVIQISGFMVAIAKGHDIFKTAPVSVRNDCLFDEVEQQCSINKAAKSILLWDENSSNRNQNSVSVS